MSDRASRPLPARRKWQPVPRHALLPFIFFLLLQGCTTEADNTYDPGTANTKILSMFALRDSECDTSHQVTGLIFARADRTNVDLCINALYLLDCSAWKASDPTPAVCKAIGVSLK